jgi:hypothetical protein
VPEPANSAAGDSGDAAAEVRHLPVLAEPREARPLPPSEPAGALATLRALPAPVVAAAGGFLAGVAAFLLVRLLRRPARVSAGGRLSLGRRRGRDLEVSASRSFLVDIHLLKQR